METGAKYINRSNKSKTHVEYTDAESLNTGNDFNHTTQVAAAYVEGIAAMGKWSLRAGLRYEYSHMKCHLSRRLAAGLQQEPQRLVPAGKRTV